MHTWKTLRERTVQDAPLADTPRKMHSISYSIVQHRSTNDGPCSNTANQGSPRWRIYWIVQTWQSHLQIIYSHQGDSIRRRVKGGEWGEEAVKTKDHKCKPHDMQGWPASPIKIWRVLWTTSKSWWNTQHLGSWNSTDNTRKLTHGARHTTCFSTQSTSVHSTLDISHSQSWKGLRGRRIKGETYMYWRRK